MPAVYSELGVLQSLSRLFYLHDGVHELYTNEFGEYYSAVRDRMLL